LSKRNVLLTDDEWARRFKEGRIFEESYKNPFVLASLYYTFGYSTVDIAQALHCDQRTVRRYMNYYGFRRFSKSFALLVKEHGIDGALKLAEPTFYPLGTHND
jgi:hypothetical protein